MLTLSTGFVWVAEALVLAPLDLSFLRTMTFILVIAAVVQFTEMVIRRISPPLYEALGVYLPLITTNCAVLGIALLTIQGGHSFVGSLLRGFGSAAGFGLVRSFLPVCESDWRWPECPKFSRCADRLHPHRGGVVAGIHGFCRTGRLM